MKSTLKPLLLLFISGFLLMLGYGLSNILLPVRMQSDGISLDNMGLVLSMLYVGFVLGAYYSRSLLQSVGHIRIFAMGGSLTSVAILLSGLYPDPIILALMRVLTGFCIACINATLDSWLSDSATEKNRGRILSINQMMVMTALFAGQFLLNVAPIEDITLFVICGILFSLSITPIVISRLKGPVVEDSQSMSLMTVLKLSPLGVVCSFYSGFLYAGLINMLPIFASQNGITGIDLSIFMGAAIFGAIILQFPIAYLADNFDRRKVMLLMVATLIGLCFTVSLLLSNELFTLSLVVIALITGLVACFYPMSMAETFETVVKEQILSAMSSVLFIYALGSIVGPYLASVTMEIFGSRALFSFVSIVAISLLFFIIVLMKLRQALPLDSQESFIMQTPSGVVSELDPRTEYAQAQFESTAEVEVAINLATKNPSAAVNMVKALVLRDPANASNLAAALSTIDAIDISKLYAAITAAAPEMSLHIAQALTNASPEQADQLVDWITTEYPDQFTNIVVAIANAMPNDGIELMALAAENMGEEYASELLEMTEEYVTQLSDSLDDMRPVDRVAAAPENTATELYNRLTDVSPEQSEELAFTVSESLPEASNDVAEAYVQNLIESESDNESDNDNQNNNEQTFSADALDNIEHAATSYVNHMVENVPEHAVDIASTFVESFPEVASDMLEILQDSDDIEDSELSADIDDKPLEDVVEQQLQDAVQTQSEQMES
ncbi:MFS transporter [uncultured Shewanella sp.]|uniref:MFS transporter n=1 Tax=uncultured Shewanella sp. TaxID=173975 RepID=UPI00260486F7|nr:MFS transporter [uncultured Shewanella sp.]